MSDSIRRQQEEAVQQMLDSFSAGTLRPSVVEMRQDYENDPAICTTSVALPPKALLDRIEAQILTPLRALEPDHYYYPTSSFHMTIRNVRTIDADDLSEGDLQKVEALFAEEVPQHVVFPVMFDRFARYPTSLALIGYTNREHVELVASLGEGLERVGVPDDKVYARDDLFWMSMTVCRLSHEPSEQFLKEVERLEHALSETVQVSEVQLVQCNAVFAETSRVMLGTYSLSPSK